MGTKKIGYATLKELAPYIDDEICKIFDKNVINIATRYESNPYSIIPFTNRNTGMPYVSFLEVDEHMDVEDLKKKYFRFRLDAAIYHVLTVNEHHGSSWLPVDVFIDRLERLFKRTKHPLDRKIILTYVNHIANNPIKKDEKQKISIVDGRVARCSTMLAELCVKGKLLHAINYENKYKNFKPIDETGLIDEVQYNAAMKIMTSTGMVSMLIGGPGTGKSTVLKAIAKGIKAIYPKDNIVFLAPTGKAVKNIKDIFKRDNMEDIYLAAETIHKFLALDDKNVQHLSAKSKAKIENTNILIIDETSMVPIELLAKLLETVNLSLTKIIFVGDSHQLPAIGIGSLIDDFKTLGVVYAELTKNYRSNVTIYENAKTILQGKNNYIEDDSFKVIEIPEDKIYDELLNVYHINDIILSPYKTDQKAGNIRILNDKIQTKRFNGEKTIKGRFNRGDEVILLKNNYEKNYYNGDTGIVIGVNGETDEYIVEKHDGDTVYVKDEDDIDLGYALTIHKSQGSEYEEVDIVLPEFANFITREMFYTAITRAKERVRIWTTSKDIIKKILLNPIQKRRSFLHMDEDTEEVFCL